MRGSTRALRCRKSAAAAESRRWLRCGRDSEKTPHKEVWSLQVLSEKLLSFWPEQGEHVFVKTQRERDSVKKKKEPEEPCIQVNCF